MAIKQKPELEDKKQSQRFVETARKLGMDESGHKFNRALVVVITPKKKKTSKKKS